LKNRFKRTPVRIKGILFDFDGTLTLPGSLDFPAIKRELGCPYGEPILEFLETVGPTRRKHLMKALEEKEEIAAKGSRPNRGAEECIVALLRRGILLGILTRNSLVSVKRALEQFSEVRIGHFRTVVTRDFALPKPHPDGVYRAAQEMGISPSELLVAGDFRFDVLAGKAAGAKTVLLTNGEGSSMAHNDPEPDYIIDELAELLHIV
jgi:HAD superfamily hydrolase (TIGR01509 family)